MRVTRRQMLGAGVAAALGVAARPGSAAVVPPTPSKGSGTIRAQLKLSVAAYSFRDLLPGGKSPATMTLHDLLDLAAVWRLDAVEPTSYYFTSEERDYLHSLKAKAFKLGLDISGTAVRNNFCLSSPDARAAEIAHVSKWVDHAVELGAPCIRIFAGRKNPEATDAQTFDWVVECTKAACDYAGSRGVFLAIENHGYLTETAEQVLRIVEEVNHEWLGVNLDTGNFSEDPYGSMALLAPKAITVQVKTEVQTAAGKEAADIPRILNILREANYRGYVALEYEGKDDPMTAVPQYLAKLREAITF